jgi:hypothetical protein
MSSLQTFRQASSTTDHHLSFFSFFVLGIVLMALHLLHKCVRLKRGMEGNRRWLNISTGFIQEREPVDRVSSRRARVHCHTQPWRRYRELVKTTRKITKEYCCWATQEDKLWLGHCLLNCPRYPPRDKG